MSHKPTAPVARKVWRMSANAPLGEIVQVDPSRQAANQDAAETEFEDLPETGWQESSYALLSGCQVKDYTSRIPDRVFNALFKDE